MKGCFEHPVDHSPSPIIPSGGDARRRSQFVAYLLVVAGICGACALIAFTGNLLWTHYLLESNPAVTVHRIDLPPGQRLKEVRVTYLDSNADIPPTYTTAPLGPGEAPRSTVASRESFTTDGRAPAVYVFVEHAGPVVATASAQPIPER